VSVHGRKQHVIGYLRDFLFRPEQARTPIRALSGGERNRLLLAKQLAQPANLLVLDEPTNDLDVDTLDLLQEILVEFAGTLLLVSHDRDFLDRLVTSVIVFEGDGRLQEYAGGYGDMLRQRTAPAPSARAPSTAPARLPGPGRGATPLRARSRAQRELDRLLGQVEALTGEISCLEDELADPDLFRREPEAFAARTARLAAARDDLHAAEQRWLDLAADQEQVT
jgi:ATP-binding cassette subfamily F protein uup